MMYGMAWTPFRPRSDKEPSKQRPGMTVFDSSPNARSKTLKTVEGPHTYGRLNEMPAHHGTYTLGIAEDVGARRTMEDAYSFVVDYAGLQGQGFFAVFDGHAGKHAAEWCGAHFHEMLLTSLLEDTTHPIPEVMANTFKSVDEVLTKMSESGTTNSGCTAVTAFLRLEDSKGQQSFAPPLSSLVPAPTVTPESSRSGQNSESNSRASTPTSSKRVRLKNLVSGPFGNNHNPSKKSEVSEAEPASPSHAINPNTVVRRVLYTANVGDARAVLARQGRAVRLTYDHKGSDAKEVRRIQEAGGFVLNNRVNGVLAVTRSLGDSAMKDFVVGSPYSSEVELEDGDEFLIIACDGLWDVVEDQGAVDLIKDAKTAQSAADILLRHALDNFSHDNVTVLVVMFGKQGDAEQGMASSAA